jgi:galactokinase
MTMPLERNPSLDELTEQAACQFRSVFGHDPTHFAAAPGRVNLIGEHIDYNDGFVLPLAIERYVVIAGRPICDSSEPLIRLFSDPLRSEISFPLRNLVPDTTRDWAKYVAGVVAGYQDRQSTLPSIEACIVSSIPLGGGLSSSAALEVAAATLLEQITQTCLEPVEKALLCQRAEHLFAGVPCGIMDQFSSVFGRSNELLLLDCRSQTIEPVPFLFPDWTILVSNSNVKHALTGGEYAQRRAQCDQALHLLNKPSWRDVSMEEIAELSGKHDNVLLRRARHVVGEIVRTQQAAQALGKSDGATLGTLMNASHDSLRDDFQVSCDELDVLVDIARTIGPAGGVIGSRMTGGGFGGCTVSLIETSRAEEIATRIRFGYQDRTGIEPTLFVTRPAPGAMPIYRP